MTKMVILLFIFIATVYGSKILHEADNVEDLPLFAYSLKEERNIGVKYDLLQNRVLLVKHEESDGVIPESVAFAGNNRKLLQSPEFDLSSILAIDETVQNNGASAPLETPEEQSQVTFSSDTEFGSSSSSMGTFVAPTQNTSFETIVGTDDRLFVFDTRAFPYRVIGRLTLRCDGRLQACTGTLIGPRTVMTSAHCIQSQISRCTDFNFTPGQQQSSIPFRTVKGVAAEIPAQYAQTFGIDFDYGIITLAEDIGLEVGWMGFGYSCTTTLQDLQTAGYPNDLDPFSTTMYEAKCDQQSIDACPCSTSIFDTCSTPSSNTFRHTCDTFAGQSGSPMWTYINPDFPQIRGIHSSGFSRGAFDERNTALFINNELFRFFRTNM
eukprot:TRINITY_DN1799_c0_g2_i1.p1 TRINITY_DN1799_c0_g2~~TRINITY_DN1799_c0_g2_i1.p1  ORF type:complete len:380 (-),score=26.28 TRINITY_DN1799_c0_g2_i1:1262-2401(-)